MENSMKANTEKTELALQQASQSVSEFVIDLRQEVEAIEKQYADIVPIATTKDGYKHCKAVRAELMPIKTGIDKQRKALKQPILEAGKLIDSSLNPLIDRVANVMKPFVDAYQAVDNEIKRKEEERKATIEKSFADLHSIGYAAMGQTSNAIEGLIEELSEFDFDPAVFQERINEAINLQSELMGKLTDMLTNAIANEESARLAKEHAQRIADIERREAELIRKEQMEQQRAQTEQAKQEQPKAPELANAKSQTTPINQPVNQVHADKEVTPALTDYQKGYVQALKDTGNENRINDFLNKEAA